MIRNHKLFARLAGIFGAAIVGLALGTYYFVNHQPKEGVMAFLGGGLLVIGQIGLLEYSPDQGRIE